MRKNEIRKLADSARETCEQIRDELQEEFDDKSERWRESDKGDEMQSLIDSADEAVNALDTILSALES